MSLNLFKKLRTLQAEQNFPDSYKKIVYEFFLNYSKKNCYCHYNMMLDLVLLFKKKKNSRQVMFISYINLPESMQVQKKKKK